MKTKQHLLGIMHALAVTWNVRKLNRHERRASWKVARLLRKFESKK